MQRDGRVAIGWAGLQDASDVADLLVAVDRHYLGAEHAPGRPAALAMVERVMREGEGTLFALARSGGMPAGLACVARVRPGHLLQGVLWVKDLFVAEPCRGDGLGQAMMAFLAAYAREQGLGRIDLTTEPGNAGAQRFYDRLGGERKPKVFYRFEGDVLERLAGEGGGGPGQE
jgi:GNAT superfamily N-acetyltransferase